MNKKNSSKLPRARIGMFKLLLLSNQQPKTLWLDIYDHKLPQNSANPFIWEHFAWKIAETIILS